MGRPRGGRNADRALPFPRAASLATAPSLPEFRRGGQRAFRATFALTRTRWNSPLRAIVAVLAFVLATGVHALAREAGDKAKPAAAKTEIVAPASEPLPAPVRDMVEGIRAAVQSGSIEELRTPFEWNEMKPMVADETVDDPIAYWKKASGDGEGREILAILGKLLDSRPARLPIGKDPENTAVYVWPYLAETPLDKLTPAQEVELYRLVTPAEARAMREKKKWTWYRLAIGADGTWHSFMRHGENRDAGK